MKVTQLSIANFRNIDLLTINPGPHLNFITGHNGAGKTSILEALYYISNAKTFKSSNTKAMIQEHQPSFSVLVEIDVADKQQKQPSELALVDHSSFVTTNAPIPKGLSAETDVPNLLTDDQLQTSAHSIVTQHDPETEQTVASELAEVSLMPSDSNISAIEQDNWWQQSTIQVTQGRQDRELIINDQPGCKQAQASMLLPIQIISPDTVNLLVSGPDQRRLFVNWGMFYTYDHFNELWKKYRFAHKSRVTILANAKSLLANNRPIPASLKQEILAWTQLVCKYSVELDALYADYMANLTPVLQQILHNLLPELTIDCYYYRGWPKDQDLYQTYLEKLDHDMEVGRSSVGLNRFDLVIKCYGELVQNVLSRGQLKLLACALKIAQGDLLQQQRDHKCIYLVDDLAAELDAQKQLLFAKELIQENCQIFMTYINNQDLHIFSQICDSWYEFAISKGQVVQRLVNGELVTTEVIGVDDLISQATTVDVPAEFASWQELNELEATTITVTPELTDDLVAFEPEAMALEVLASEEYSLEVETEMSEDTINVETSLASRTTEELPVK